MKPDAATTAFIRRILSVAETGKADFDPGAVYVYRDDHRFKPARKQVTVSLGFTENGNLRAMLERYSQKGGQYGGELQAYLPGMGNRDRPTLANNKKFLDLLKQAGRDLVMRETQEEIFDEKYLGPAFEWAEKFGFQEPMSYLVIADSFLHSGSMLPFLMNRFPEKKPSDGGDEKEWIRAYLAARHKWLATHSNTILNKTVYRADAYLREIARENWNLTGPIVMHGTAVNRIA